MPTIPTRLAVAALLLAAPGAAWAATDPIGDFLATSNIAMSNTGALHPDLDLVSATAGFDGTNFILSSTSLGAIGTSAGSLFVWGINRGQGTDRLGLGGGVLFDAVAVFFPDGTARIATFPAMGAPVITPLSGAVTVSGATITGLAPLALLPSTGLAPQAYTFTLWSRLRVNPAADGSNAEVADFAPNGAGLRAGAVPEPATWATMIAGFGLVGGAMRGRRRQRRPLPA